MWFLVRIFVLGAVAVIVSFWALVQFYTRPRLPLLVPATPTQGTEWDAGAGTKLIPAPEIQVEGR